MNIIADDSIKPKLFKDLERGDVFYFFKKCAEDMKEFNPQIRIYMKCGNGSTDKTAVNLETGDMYSFDDNESVVLLDAYLKVTRRKE